MRCRCSHFFPVVPFADVSHFLHLTLNSFLLDCSYLSARSWDPPHCFHLYCFCVYGLLFLGAACRLHLFARLWNPSAWNSCLLAHSAVCWFCFSVAAVVFSGRPVRLWSTPFFVKSADVHSEQNFLHVEFIRCIVNELYCDVGTFKFLVNEPRCEGGHSVFFQVGFCVDFRVLQSFNFLFVSSPPFLHFFIFQFSWSSPFRLSGASNFQEPVVLHFQTCVSIFSCSDGCVAFWCVGSKASSLDPSHCFVFHPVHFFSAV